MKVKLKILTTLDLTSTEIDCSKCIYRKNVEFSITDEFVESVGDIGIFQSLIVEKIDDKYYLIDGYRRLLAAKKAGLQKVPCLVAVGFLAPLLGILDIVHKKNLHIIERAENIKRAYSQFNGTQKAFAKLIGTSEQTISDDLKIASLPDDIKGQAIKENIPKRDLLKLSRKKNNSKNSSSFPDQGKKNPHKNERKGSNHSNRGRAQGSDKVIIQRINKLTEKLISSSHHAMSSRDKKHILLAIKELNYTAKKIKTKSDASDFITRIKRLFIRK